MRRCTPMDDSMIIRLRCAPAEGEGAGAGAGAGEGEGEGEGEGAGSGWFGLACRRLPRLEDREGAFLVDVPRRVRG